MMKLHRFLGQRLLRGAAAAALVAGLLACFPTSVSGQKLTKEQRVSVEAYGDAYVRALNGDPEGDAAAIEQVFAAATMQSIGVERLKGQLARIRSLFGKLEYHHSEVAEFPRGSLLTRILYVYARQPGANQWKQFQFRLEANPPYRITELAFIAEVAEPVYLPNGALSEPMTLQWLYSYIDKLVEQNQLSGNVLVSVGGKALFERAFGFADAKSTVPVTVGTRFNLGSGNKMMTAVAVAQLAEKGLLSYEDPIIKYFPDFPNAEHARKTTIHHLLSHTSGIGEYWTDEYEKNWNNIRTPADQLPWVYKAGVLFPSGSEFRYSNSNFVLAGLIVEKVSKMSYFDYVKKHIYEPAGMTLTDHYLMDGSVKGLAERLKRTATGWEEAPHGARGGPAGGGYSTTHDMLRFIQALKSGKLVSAATLKTMTASKTASLPGGMDYGYGFILGRSGQETYFGHGGTARGVNFELAYFPASDTTLVMFCNQDNGAYDDLKKNLIKLISGYR